MAWSLGSCVIYPSDRQYSGSVEAYYAVQEVLDATANYIAYYGASSQRRTLEFVLDEDANSNGGRVNLTNATSSGSSMVLTSDRGGEGTYKIMSFKWRRRQALNHTYNVYDCTAELISTT